jgi:hypothetical protein
MLSNLDSEEHCVLGDKIGEETGKVTGQRVLATDGPPTVETSFQASGSLYGVNHTTIGTYQAKMRPDGSLFGEGQGVVMTADGGHGTWKGSGIGKFGPGGSVSYRGAIYYQTTTSSLQRLSEVAAVFEYDVDGDGNTVGRLWEWK